MIGVQPDAGIERTSTTIGVYGDLQGIVGAEESFEWALDRHL